MRTYPLSLGHRDQSATIRPVGSMASLTAEAPFFLEVDVHLGIAGRDQADIAFRVGTGVGAGAGAALAALAACVCTGECGRGACVGRIA